MGSWFRECTLRRRPGRDLYMYDRDKDKNRLVTNFYHTNHIRCDPHAAGQGHRVSDLVVPWGRRPRRPGGGQTSNNN
jgi:hypothetical protein